MLSLPNELLAAIAHEGRLLGRSIHALRNDSFPFEILCSHISKRWRQVVIHTPSLWSIVHLHRCPRGKLLEMILERGRDVLIDVTFDLRPYKLADGHYITPTLYPNLEKLIEHLGRVRNLSFLHTPAPERMLIMERLRDVRAPRIEHFEISMDREPMGSILDMHKNPEPIFSGGAPILSSVKILTPSLVPGCIPLSRVTTLELGPTSYLQWPFSVLRRVLAESPALEKLTLIKFPIRFSSGGEKPFEMPSLVTLTIVAPSTPFEYTSLLCLALSAPSLQTLHIDHHGKDYEAMQVAVTSLHFPALKTLELQGVYLDEKTATKLVAALPTITRLSLLYGDTTSLLSALINSEDSDVDKKLLCPRLRHINFASFKEEDMEIWWTLVTSRILKGRLSHIGIRDKRELSVDRLEWLASNGMIPDKYDFKFQTF